MSKFRLNLPTDIPWERICVSEDMIDRNICDSRLPAKWQTSLAAFKYRPADEFQLFPKYDITYLKISATITGYQPLDKEVQGQINWDGLSKTTLNNFSELLSEYHPCNGALLQVLVGPKKDENEEDLDKYPFFMDFEPKKRELFELANDTHEKQSRSIESLNITKSGGSTQSMEVFDIDMGGSTGGSLGIEGVGEIGFNTSSQGQWGTKRINAEESMAARSTDVGTEKRESFSYSTQLTQMYHLLDSYHIGTNRLLFFIQPRPHTLEEPSYFVRGPRPVEGIQEFFAVVAQPKGRNDFCVSLRLDTSHIKKVPIMSSDSKTELTNTALANADLPSKNDDYAGREPKWNVSYGIFGTDEINYVNYTKTVVNDVVYEAPQGYTIVSWDEVIDNIRGEASNTVTVSSDRKTLTIHSRAKSSVWFKDEGAGACIDNCPPDTLHEKTSRAEMQLRVHLTSIGKTKQTGSRDALMITTRGLCCCKNDFDWRDHLKEYVVDLKEIPKSHGPDKKIVVEYNEQHHETVNPEEIAHIYSKMTSKHENCPECQKSDSLNKSGYSIRQANELSKFIKSETIKSFNNPLLKMQRYVDTSFFAKELEYKLRQHEIGRSQLNKSCLDYLGKGTLAKLEEYFKKDGNKIVIGDLLSLNDEVLSEVLKTDEKESQKIRLQMLGIEFKKEDYRKS